MAACAVSCNKTLFKPSSSAPRQRGEPGPPKSLDAASAEDVLTLLSRLNKEFGKTVVLVTHDPHAARHATVTHHLEKGELLPDSKVVA